MHEAILDRLPYTAAFRFVDAISLLNNNEVEGSYTLKKDSFFYAGHFPGFPVTPGAIITEIMAQTGLVVLGIYLMQHEQNEKQTPEDKKMFPLLTSADVSFYKIVLPGERVTVVSKKKYFRFNKLKCYVEMFDQQHELVAKGMFSGMIKNLFKDIIL